VITMKAQIVRMHLPPDRNTFPSLADPCVRSRNYASAIVAGDQAALHDLIIGRGDGALHLPAGDLAVGSGTAMAGRPPWASIHSAARHVSVRSVNDLACLRAWNAVRAGSRPGIVAAHGND
jgi:hypothetical protein